MTKLQRENPEIDSRDKIILQLKTQMSTSNKEQMWVSECHFHSRSKSKICFPNIFISGKLHELSFPMNNLGGGGDSKTQKTEVPKKLRDALPLSSIKMQSRAHLGKMPKNAAAQLNNDDLSRDKKCPQLLLTCPRGKPKW